MQEFNRCVSRTWPRRTWPYRKEHRFHFALGAVHRQLGEEERARASFERAIELADDEQAAEYQCKSELLKSAPL
jgi:predicted RNA polymerase sigma factor